MDSIGKNLKHIRNIYKITQKDVAEGICSQAMVSKIENNEELYPSVNLIYQLSQKLGVSIEYFLSEDCTNFNYIQVTIEEIFYLVEQGRFNEAYDLIKLEKNNPFFKSKNNAKKFLIWKEAICISKITQNHRLSIKMIDELFINKKFYSLNDLNILSSKIVFLLNLEEIEEAYDLHSLILYNLNKIPYYESYYSKFIFINIYYICTKAAYHFGKLEKAKSYCEKALKTCDREQTYYKLSKLKDLKNSIIYDFSVKTSQDREHVSVI